MSQGEVYLKRKIDKFLVDWKSDPNHLPLIIKGARQVGKTRSISNFGFGNYKSFISINFIEEPKYKMIVEDGFSVESIIANISRIDPLKKFVPGETLILFDEVQSFPDIMTSLKFFNEDGKYDVICSGSLLGINYKQITSVSVGNKIDYEMKGLDFEEFLWAKGYDDSFVSSLFSKMRTLTPFSKLEFEVTWKLFFDFVLLGGMPAVIRRYIELGTFEGSLDIQRQIVLDYENDVRKYVSGIDQTRIINVFRAVSPQLAKENKKFQISKVAKGARFSEYRGCVEWLEDSGIINVCRKMTFPELPLNGNYEPDIYKIYMADTGLLISCLDEEVQEELRARRNLGCYGGALFENLVGEALSKQGRRLFYYKREDSTLEEDFFVRSLDELIPVEVKATNNRSKSLGTLISSDRYPDIKHGIKLVNGNVGYNNRIFTFPLFCTFLIGRWLKEVGDLSRFDRK